MDTNEEKADTIKALIVEKIQQQRQLTTPQETVSEEDIRKMVGKYLHVACLTFPGENNRDKNPAGVEFADIMFGADKDLHNAAERKIIEKIMEERDDLVDYPNLRQKIVEAITTTESWRELYDAVSYKDLQY